MPDHLLTVQQNIIAAQKCIWYKKQRNYTKKMIIDWRQNYFAFWEHHHNIFVDCSFETFSFFVFLRIKKASWLLISFVNYSKQAKKYLNKFIKNDKMKGCDEMWPDMKPSPSLSNISNAFFPSLWILFTIISWEKFYIIHKDIAFLLQPQSGLKIYFVVQEMNYAIIIISWIIWFNCSLKTIFVSLFVWI